MRAPVLLLAAAACAGAPRGAPGDTAGDPVPEDLAATLPAPGPFGVGYQTTELRYPDPAGGGERALYLAWWYPSSEDTAGAEIRYRGAFPATGVVEGAPWADGGDLPVVVFSHGHQGYAENSSFLMAHLASHGFVVVAPDHTGNTTFDDPTRLTPIYYQRPLDISAVLDEVLADAHVDPGAVLAVGHSFGGYTLFADAGGAYDGAVLAACLDGSDTSSFCSTMTGAEADRFRAGFAEPRVSAWVTMAPGDQRLFGAQGLAGLDRPVLLMTGSLDPAVGADAAPYWAALPRGESRWVSVEGGGHQTWTDFSGLIENIDGLIEAEEGFAIARAYVLAFARRWALGDTTVQPVLEGEVTFSEAVTLSR